MNRSEKTDTEIINRVLDGKTDDYGILVERYEKLVFSFLLSRSSNAAEVEDAVQETFIKAYNHLSTFDCERKFSSWLIAIARNVMIDLQRKTGKDLPSDDLVMDVLLSDSSKNMADETAETLLRKERFHQIATMIRSLPEDFKTPFLLRVINEMSYQDIADNLDLPLQTVKNRIFKARAFLKERSDKCL